VKAEEFRNLQGAEFGAKEAEIREQMFRLKFQLSMGQTDGLRKYRGLRKDLARLLTVQREKEQAS
jgi:large subunit ribosomal protein L29